MPKTKTPRNLNAATDPVAYDPYSGSYFIEQRRDGYNLGAVSPRKRARSEVRNSERVTPKRPYRTIEGSMSKEPVKTPKKKTYHYG